MMTQMGVILGTAAYMSPEQARGQPVDKRTDIWAFGCVCLEMLTGRAPFARDTVSDSIAAVLEREPDWALLPETTPAALRRLLRKCLEKDLRRRLRDIGDARMEIEEAMAVPAAGATTNVAAPASGIRVTWLMALGTGLALAAVGIGLSYWRDRPAPTETVRLSLSAPGQFFTTPPDAVLSPDGRQMALVASDPSGKDVLWIRSLDSQNARPLPGTERADLPFWSPDSRFLGFFADGKLKKVAAAGGPVQVLSGAPVSPGATWNQDGTILFSLHGALLTVSSTGGATSQALAPPAGGSAMWPHFLPDGRHFLYFRQSMQQSERGVYVGSLDTKETRLLLNSEFEGTFAPPGYLLFVRDEALMAQPFDAKRLELSGEPALLAEGAWVAKGYGHGVFSAGSNGTLAYVNAAIANTQLAWFDRGGRPLGAMARRRGMTRHRNFRRPAKHRGRSRPLFQSGHLAAGSGALDETRDSRLIRRAAGSRSGSLMDAGLCSSPQRGERPARLYEKSADGAGADEQVSGSHVNLQDVSPTGGSRLHDRSAERHFELWVLPLSGDRKPFPFLQTPSNNGQASLPRRTMDRLHIQRVRTRRGLRAELSQWPAASARFRPRAARSLVGDDMAASCSISRPIRC